MARRRVGVGFVLVALVAEMLVAGPVVAAQLRGLRPGDPGPLASARQVPPVAEALLPAGERTALAVGEDTGSRSGSAEVWVNADGTRTARLFSRPKYFQRDRLWVPIDSSVVPDGEGAFRSAANGWTARFSSAGVAVETPKGTVRFAPTGAALGAPQVTAPSTVRFAEVWPGVDLEYSVEPDGVVERLVVLRPQDRSSFPFSVEGAGLADDPDGGLRFTGSVAETARFGAPVVLDRAGEPVPAARPALDDVSKGSGGSRLALSVDPGWLAAQPDSAYPIVVDPDLHVGPLTIHSYANGGYDGGATGKVGNALAGGDRYWRTETYFDYWAALAGKQIISAQVATTKQAGGTDVSNPMYMFEFTAWGWNNGGAYLGSGTLGATGSTAAIGGTVVRDLVQSWVNASNPYGAFMLAGNETSGVYTYKPVTTQLDVVYSTPPSVPLQVGPKSGVVVPTATPTLVANPSTDADVGDVVSYRFVVAVPSGATVWTSPLTTARQVAVAPDVLKDGATYAWKVDAVDTYGVARSSAWWNLRVDRRLSGATVPMDSQGPVGVNLATGNVSTSISTPSVATLGGAAVVSLAYHSANAASNGQAGALVVPRGWTMSGGAAEGGWVRAVVNPAAVVLQGADGDTAEYTTTDAGKTFVAPPGTLGRLSRAPGGELTLDEDGTISAFTATGLLQTVTSAADTGAGTAWTHVWSGTGQLLSVTDPVSAQAVLILAYQGTGTCPAAPTGFDAAPPAGMLCKVTVAGHGDTNVFYKYQALARVANPGGEVTDYGYDAAGRLTLVRDPLQLDWVGQDPATRNTLASMTEIAYDAQGRPSSVTLAAPDGLITTARPAHSYTYRTGYAVASWFAYDAGFTGGVDVAAGDLDGDGVAEVVAGPATASDLVGVYTAFGTVIRWFNAFGGFTGGVNVAVGDVEGDATPEIVVGKASGGSTVAVLSATGTLLRTFEPYGGFTGGADVAVGNVDGTGKAEIVTGPGAGGTPTVSMFTATGTQVATFNAYAAAFSGGVRVSTGDLDVDGVDEVITGAGPGGGPHVVVWRKNGTTATMLLSRFDLAAGFAGGIDVAGTQGQPGYGVSSLTQDSAALLPTSPAWATLAYPGFSGGARVAMGDVQGLGVPALVVGPGPGGGPNVKVYAPYQTAEVTVAGLTPAPANGWSRRVSFDTSLRTIRDVDAGGRASLTSWDPVKDQTTATIDPSGRKSTAIYDSLDRPTDTYGPAPKDWYGYDNRPTPARATEVPHTATGYDETAAGVPMVGLNGTIWANTDLRGAPASTVLSGAINTNWVTGGPGGLTDNWSARWTGQITFPQAGAYSFRYNSDDGVRLWIDDTLIIDAWTDHPAAYSPPGTTISGAAGEKHRIRVEYYDRTGSASLALYWTPPGGTETIVPVGNLTPAYNLATTTTVTDTGGAAPTQVILTGYDTNPDWGIPQATTTDPGGLNLTTTIGLEPAGTGHRRLTNRWLPAGNITDAATGTTTTYYADTAQVDNPCTPAADPAPQRGQAATDTGPDPDGTGPQTGRIEESVYAAGRSVASRVNGSAWSCTTYDSRGRTTSQTQPSYGIGPARTVVASYSVDGLTTTTSDAAGTVSAVVDLLGRVTSSTDTWNKTTTTTYDQAGRPTTTGPSGTLTTTYRADGLAQTASVDGTVVATPTWSSAGELDTVIYPNGVNGTFTRDAFGEDATTTWSGPGGTITSEVLTRSRTGRVTDATVDGTDPNPTGPNYTYDPAGRLTDAWTPGHLNTYGYGTATCGSPAAGRNTNRTTTTDNGGLAVVLG